MNNWSAGEIDDWPCGWLAEAFIVLYLHRAPPQPWAHRGTLSDFFNWPL